MHQPNLAKIVEINSNLGVRKSPPRFQARCSIEGLTGLALGLERLQILWLLLTYARTRPNHTQIPKIQSLKLTQTHLLICSWIGFESSKFLP